MPTVIPSCGPATRVPCRQTTVGRLTLAFISQGARVFPLHPLPALEEKMTITGVITAILIGIVVGVLGRLLVPGRQPIGMLVTVLIGIVGAFVGTAIARALGIPTATAGIDWLELLVQVIVAAVGVALVSALMGRRRTGVMGRRRSGLMR
jgi:uncharacterized membrane protein YeaQ/YmgE (transglycosylase-associated protein family)